jgi:hypothetical protein
MKINKENLFIYSVDTAGTNSSVGNATALAVKTYSFSSQHFMKIKHYDDEDSTNGKIDWIIRNGSILNKKIKFFNSGVDIKGVFNLKSMPKNDDVKYVRNVVMSDNKLKFSLTGDEPHVIRDISLDGLNAIIDPSLSDVSFTISTKEFENARAVSQIDPDDTIKIIIEDGNIYFKQDTWELLVGEVDFDGTKQIAFNKKYLKSIKPNIDEVHFLVFPTFLVYKEANQRMMIGYEKSF